ncbi:MAG: hypothetical protein U1A23_04185 [Candidatus Sungbacteria bacterium]|nr:hypothetical protein [Candidatus Sungbacteria bacterium]
MTKERNIVSLTDQEVEMILAWIETNETNGEYWGRRDYYFTRLKKLKAKLKGLNPEIQVCECGKVDAYKDDGHSCEQHIQQQELQG